MIIQICGTNGSGKSTVVRKLMEIGKCEPIRVGDKPVGYILNLPSIEPIEIIGPYENPTGGCDNIKTIEAIHDRIRNSVEEHVIFEGAGHTMNQTRGPALLESFTVPEPFVVVLLTTPYGDCLAGINQRRAERGEEPLLDDKHIRGNHVRARNYASRMRDAGARLVRADRSEAPKIIQNILCEHEHVCI